VSNFHTIQSSIPRFERDGLRYVTVKSEALGHRADLSVFLPEAEERNLPLVILLHGIYSSHWGWSYCAGAHRTAARLIAEEEIPPLVLAMPSDGLWGDGSGYFAHHGKDFDRWIVDEVPVATREAGAPVSDASPCFIAGLSMGGFGALSLGARFGEKFEAISAHSSVTDLRELDKVVEESLLSGPCHEGDFEVLQTLIANREKLPPTRFDCGLDDSLLSANRELHRSLAERGIEHVYEEFSGGHEWSYWERHLVDTLRFFAEHLR